ncbi:hypothetical protein [Phenylobacterium sp.]|jgi:hypothetical protein|uniref:hypothetical protein n=1 Tax=Phenylobacterium sp. TaxID=1871053 RepID=UPI002F938AE2
MRPTLLLRDEHRSCTFHVRERAGVWEVTRDHVFHGDYLSRAPAVRSACSAARSFEAAGGRARVLVAPGDQQINHQDVTSRS